MIPRGLNLPWHSQDGRVTPIHDLASDHLSNLGPWIEKRLTWLPYFRWLEELESDALEVRLSDEVAGGDANARLVLADLMETRGLTYRANRLRAIGQPFQWSLRMHEFVRDPVECAWLSLICHPELRSLTEEPGIPRTAIYAEQVRRETRWREHTGFTLSRDEAAELHHERVRTGEQEVIEAMQVPYGLALRRGRRGTW